jgi:hypothetical protein
MYACAGGCADARALPSTARTIHRSHSFASSTSSAAIPTFRIVFTVRQCDSPNSRTWRS